jgi:hypothetical protein
MFFMFCTDAPIQVKNQELNTAKSKAGAITCRYIGTP